jgi:hypothetical protein
MVRPAGLEPARPKALRFERSVYSNSNQGRGNKANGALRRIRTGTLERAPRFKGGVSSSSNQERMQCE